MKRFLAGLAVGFLLGAASLYGAALYLTYGVH